MTEQPAGFTVKVLPRGKDVVVRCSQAPTTEAERLRVRKLCARVAKQRFKKWGFTRKQIDVQTERLYQDAVTEAKRTVREPETAPGPKLIQPGMHTPRSGIIQTPAGLYVPQSALYA